MIHYKSHEEVELIRISSLLVGKTLAEVAKHIKPGVSLLSLDKIAETFIRDHHAVPAFLGYNGFPNSLCISLNDAVVHGIPGNTLLSDGDIVSVDCGVLKNGFYGDSAFTFEVGSVKPEVQKLLRVTKECLLLGLEQCVYGNRVGDISQVIQDHAETNGFSVVRELVGHGLGRNLHEAPEVPNFGKRGKGPILKEGMVIAIEPMINLGKKEVVRSRDGWTISTRDRMPSAHFEHTVAVGITAPDVLSSFEEIENVLKKQIT